MMRHTKCLRSHPSTILFSHKRKSFIYRMYSAPAGPNIGRKKISQKRITGMTKKSKNSGNMTGIFKY